MSIMNMLRATMKLAQQALLIANHAQGIAAQNARTDGLIARYVMHQNVPALGAFTVLQDGVTGVAGDLVLLVGQTVGTQNGLYVIGAVAAGVAPLTRSPLMAAGQRVTNGSTVDVSEGLIWHGATFKAMSKTVGGSLVGTNDPVFFPKEWRITAVLVAGTVTFGATSGTVGVDGLMIYSDGGVTAREATVQITRKTSVGVVTATLEYMADGASRIAGIAPTAKLIIRASIADAGGTVNAADLSQLDVLVTNW